MTDCYRTPEAMAKWQRLYELSDYPVVAGLLRQKSRTKAKRLDGRAMAYGFSLAMPDDIDAMAGNERDLMRHLAR